MLSVLRIILRFIAERGENCLLVHVEKIDEAYNLKSSPQLSTTSQVSKAATYAPEAPLSVASPLPRYLYNVFLCRNPIILIFNLLNSAVC